MKKFIWIVFFVLLTLAAGLYFMGEVLAEKIVLAQLQKIEDYTVNLESFDIRWKDRLVAIKGLQIEPKKDNKFEEITIESVMVHINRIGWLTKSISVKSIDLKKGKILLPGMPAIHINDIQVTNVHLGSGVRMKQSEISIQASVDNDMGTSISLKQTLNYSPKKKELLAFEADIKNFDLALLRAAMNNGPALSGNIDLKASLVEPANEQNMSIKALLKNIQVEGKFPQSKMINQILSENNKVSVVAMIQDYFKDPLAMIMVENLHYKKEWAVAQVVVKTKLPQKGESSLLEVEQIHLVQPYYMYQSGSGGRGSRGGFKEQLRAEMRAEMLAEKDLSSTSSEPMPPMLKKN